MSSCKFEASDSSGDEVTLLKIMTVIQDALCSSVGRKLGDIEVCEMLETVLTTSCQMRLSGRFVKPFIGPRLLIRVRRGPQTVCRGKSPPFGKDCVCPAIRPQPRGRRAEIGGQRRYGRRRNEDERVYHWTAAGRTIGVRRA